MDTQGNITEEAVKEPVKGIQGVKEMMETGDTDSDMTTSEDRTEGRFTVDGTFLKCGISCNLSRHAV